MKIKQLGSFLFYIGKQGIGGHNFHTDVSVQRGVFRVGQVMQTTVINLPRIKFTVGRIVDCDKLSKSELAVICLVSTLMLHMLVSAIH